MPDRYLHTESSSDSRGSRAGPIDSCEGHTAPILNWLLVATFVGVIVLAGSL